MEIKLVEDAGEVAKLLSFPDSNIENCIAGERGEWIQWLVRQKEAKNKQVIIWIIYDESEIKGYVVLLDNRVLPVVNTMFIAYAISKLNATENKKLFKVIVDWAKELGVKTFTALTDNPETLKRYGFKKDKYQMIMGL